MSKSPATAAIASPMSASPASLSAFLKLPFHQKPAEAKESGEHANVRVRIDAPDLCPHYTARLIRGVKIGPSPTWMTRRLEAVGIRPINNIVDVTNYVMIELGQPLHAFDFAKITGGQIIVRNAARGESFVSIDGRKRELNPTMLVIADAERPVALAGVMGGLETRSLPGDGRCPARIGSIRSPVRPANRPLPDDEKRKLLSLRARNRSFSSRPRQLAGRRTDPANGGGATRPGLRPGRLRFSEKENPQPAAHPNPPDSRRDLADG